jgi:L-cysteine desulfidase
MDESGPSAVDIQHARRFPRTGVYSDGAVKNDLGLVSHPETGMVGIGCSIKREFVSVDTVQELALITGQ